MQYYASISQQPFYNPKCIFPFSIILHHWDWRRSSGKTFFWKAISHWAHMVSTMAVDDLVMQWAAKASTAQLQLPKNRPISQIRQCIKKISHNAPCCNKNVHILLQNGASWNMGLAHCGSFSCYCGMVNYLNILLTHLPLDKMCSIFDIFNEFSWMKSFVLRFKFQFHWSLFLRAQLKIIQHWFR